MQSEVFQTDVRQETQACLDFLQYLIGDGLLSFGQCERVKEIECFAHGIRRHFDDVFTAYQHGQALRTQALPLTVRTRMSTHILFDFLFDIIAVRLPVPAVQMIDDAFILSRIGACPPLFVGVLKRNLFST